MFISSREKAIIELIIRTSGKHTAFSTASFLNVSVRTIQRDLKTIEKILHQFQLRLVRTTDEGLLIEGKNEKIFRLVQKLTEITPVDQTPKERRLALLLILLHEGDSFKIQVLANQLNVSITTLTSYLDELTEWMKNYQVILSRKRGVGISLDGTEKNKRKALAGYFLLHFNEELIEALFLLEKSEVFQDKILGYFSPDFLLITERLVNEIIYKGPSKLTDSDYVALIITICISMQRIKLGFLLEDDEEQPPNEILEEYSIMEQLCKKLGEKYSIVFTTKDIFLLAVTLKGSKIHTAEAIHDDSVLLGSHIKNVIRNISAQLNIDLTNDFSLFQGLLAHMEPSLFRIQQKMDLFNPLTDDIKKKYPVLFMAVKDSLENEFTHLEFPENEVAFIVLHFGSALLLSEEAMSIKSLVVCPTGIGTSKMLASRIKKEIIEIDTVEIKSIKDLNQVNLNQYDVIISTVRLPFMDVDYLLVSPLLSSEEIKTIRTYLQKNLHTLTKNKYHLMVNGKEKIHSRKRNQSITDVLKEIKEVQSSIEIILKNFCVYQKKNESYQQVILEMIHSADQNHLLSQPEAVLHEIMEREKLGGLGIPRTSMALFHCRHENVHELIFQITHLNTPCIVTGMDGKDLPIKNLMLLAAPRIMNAREQEILSLISTSLIENDEAILAFSSSNEDMIRSKLEAIFLEYLHNNLIKD